MTSTEFSKVISAQPGLSDHLKAQLPLRDVLSGSLVIRHQDLEIAFVDMSVGGYVRPYLRDPDIKPRKLGGKERVGKRIWSA